MLDIDRRRIFDSPIHSEMLGGVERVKLNRRYDHDETQRNSK